MKARYLVSKPQSGHVLHYWQPTKRLIAAGFRVIRLSDDRSEAFDQAEKLNAKLDAWRSGTEIVHQKRPSDCLAELDDLFQRSEDFRRGMGERSQRDYLYNIKAALGFFGDHRVQSLTKGMTIEWHMGERDTRGRAAARNAVATLRRLLSFGVRMDWLAINPALGMRIKVPRNSGRVWTDGERDRFVATAIDMDRLSIAVAVMLAADLGQRPRDLVTLTWSAYDGRGLAVRQAKTRKRIRIPLMAEMRDVLDWLPRTAPQIVVSETTGRLYGESDSSTGLPGSARMQAYPQN